MADQQEKLYFFKINKMQTIIDFLDDLSQQGIKVQDSREFIPYHPYSGYPLQPFHYQLKDTVFSLNRPSPAIWIENPYTIEISINNKDSFDFEIHRFSQKHPDNQLIKSVYASSQELIDDLKHFFKKNSF